MPAYRRSPTTRKSPTSAPARPRRSAPRARPTRSLKDPVGQIQVKLPSGFKLVRIQKPTPAAKPRARTQRSYVRY